MSWSELCETVECFYCKSPTPKEDAQEMGLGKDEKMKYVCLGCFKQERLRGFSTVLNDAILQGGGTVYLDQGEYTWDATIETSDNSQIVGTTVTTTESYFQNVWDG